MLIDLCFKHSVKSTVLTAQCSQFLFLSVHDPKISTALERIAQIYLPYLSLFASLNCDPYHFDVDLNIFLRLKKLKRRKGQEVFTISSAISLV